MLFAGWADFYKWSKTKYSKLLSRQHHSPVWKSAFYLWTCQIYHNSWIIKPIRDYLSCALHHQHLFCTFNIIRYSRDLIFVRYFMKLKLSIRWDIAIFVDITLLTSCSCGHTVASTLTFTSFRNIMKLCISNNVRARKMIFTGRNGFHPY